MGKRQRRREREGAEPTTAQPQREHQLGTPGPFMVCRECKEPLTLFSRFWFDTGNEEKIVYIHPGEYLDTLENVRSMQKPYDHEAVPVEGDPVSADGTCDFCHAPEHRWVFVPRRPVTMPDPTLPSRELDYSSPWSCCDNCLPAVKSRKIGRMLDIAMSSPYSIITQIAEPAERRIFRTALRELYWRYLKSDPAGPYEQKIQPPHKPVGKRGSLRGQ